MLLLAIWLFRFHETKIINILIVKLYSNSILSNNEIEYECYRSSNIYHTKVRTNAIKFFGQARLPERVMLNESHSISIFLKSDLSEFYIKDKKIGYISEHENIVEYPSNRKYIKEYKNKEVLVNDFVLYTPANDVFQFIEIELQAAGLSVDGTKTQCQRLTSTNLSYYWNCHFPNSGNHEINFIIRCKKNEDFSINLGRISHEVKVLQLDHLTGNQVRAVGFISVCLSMILLLQEIM